MNSASATKDRVEKQNNQTLCANNVAQHTPMVTHRASVVSVCGGR